VPVCRNPGTPESFCDADINEQFGQVCSFGCSGGTCFQNGGQVIFRTNVDTSSCVNYGSGSKWIAYDVDNNGDLEAFGRTGGICTEFRCSNPSVNPQSIDAPNGCNLYVRDDNNICVCYDSSRPRRYSTADSDASSAVLSVSPTEPFSSNNQEVLG